MKSHRRRRVAPLIWISGGLAAVLLVLGVSGTLSAWTQAIITNDSNTVQAADSLILQESGPGSAVCNSTDGGGSGNSFTCSTIDKYGGIASPLAPGEDQSVTVTLENTGTTTGQLDLAPGVCAPSGGSVTASASICDVALVTVSCTAPSTVDTTLTPVVLSSFASATIVAALPKNTSTDCTFDVSVPSDATPQIAGQTATQPLTWTLS
ncbi:MAG TPA: hypothetical protein VN088_19660 [Nocardioides sp.]|nr:hypothetical protein [Nocardioides sp.]